MGSFLAMKFVSLVFIFALICASQQGQVCDAVLYVANACMASQNVPANVQSAVQSAISSNLGSWRRLGLYDQALNAGCTAAYNAACSAAGVPSVVQQCFQRDMVNACVNKIHELGGRRALGKKKCGKACKAMKKAKKSKKGKRELAKKKGKGKGKGKGKKSKGRKLGKKNKKAKKSKKGGKRKLGGCVAGYWPFHTRNTLNDSKFGPWNCISAGVPCAMATSTSAAKTLVKNDWKANGGQSFKYIANGYCSGEKSGSNPWVNPSGITWRFSLIRRLGKCGKKCMAKKKAAAKKNKRKLGKKGKKTRSSLRCRPLRRQRLHERSQRPSQRPRCCHLRYHQCSRCFQKKTRYLRPSFECWMHCCLQCPRRCRWCPTSCRYLLQKRHC